MRICRVLLHVDLVQHNIQFNEECVCENGSSPGSDSGVGNLTVEIGFLSSFHDGERETRLAWQKDAKILS